MLRMSAHSESQTVCVLGFHRSGTSLAARVLNLLGVDLGPEEDLLQPEEHDNPRGYWEPRWVIDINDEILAHFGARWWTSFPAAQGWETQPELQPLLDRARRLFDERLGTAPLRGWKDPRTSLTLPFWQAVAPEADALYVICLRNPADAIASLQRRPEPNLSTRQWADVWLEYVARALDRTTGKRRLIVFYEDLLRDGRAEAARLASFIERPLATGDPRLEQVLPAIEPDLRHHLTSARELATIESLPSAARAAFLSLRAARQLPDDETSAALERIVPQVWWAHVEANRAQGVADRQAEELATASTQLADARAELVRCSDTLEAGLAREQAMSERLSQSEQHLARADAALDAMKASASWRVTAPLRAVKRKLRQQA